MDVLSITLAALERGQRNIMHIGTFVPTMAPIAGGVAAGLIALWRLLISPRRPWAVWGWALAPSKLHVERGARTQVHISSRSHELNKST